MRDTAWIPFNGFKYLSKINLKNHTFKFTPVDVSQTLKVLKNIRGSKAAGPDNIPASMIKDAAEELAAPISFLINYSFETGTFPTAEKTAKVTPLYKSGERNSFNNYRPISVLSVISKVAEKLAFNQLSDYFEKNHLLSNCQYGFRRGRSTQHAVTNLVDSIRQKIDKGKHTGVLYMDFSKAFDTVNHACILHKLPFYGISGTELNWIIDYLFNRDQYVNYEGIPSLPEKITHGVPQGSILGPLLFIILINDMQSQLVKCSMLMYADDTVIFFSSKNILDIEKVINQEAELIQTWIKENCLVLNKKKGKTEFILYRSKRNGNNCIIKVGNDETNQPQSYEYLGVTLDSHLNLNEHYSKISKRISTRIKLLKKIRHEIPPTVAEQIYNSIIKPIFLYCSTINLGQSQTWENRFEKLQNQAKSVIGKTEFILYQSKRNGNNCIIKVGNDETNQPQSYEYLGVTLDSHLNLNEHYSKISKRISTRIKLLKKIRHEIPPTVAEQIYNSIIKPIFLYCSTINLGQSQTWENRFEKLQNQAKSVIGKTEFILYQSKRNGNNCIIKVGNDETNQPQSYEYLGVTLDSHLNLNEHYSKISKRISTRIKLLKKIRHEIPPTVAEQIYNSIIKPIFLYCSTINLGQSQTWENRFEKLQNQAKSVIGRNGSNWPSIKVERMRKLSLEVVMITPIHRVLRLRIEERPLETEASSEYGINCPGQNHGLPFGKA